MAFTLKRFFLSLLCCCSIIKFYAQPGQILNFEKLTINEGLSQGFIYNIAQDEKGFIWFCTPDGLNRYDGYNFKIYRHDEADSFSISSNLVTKFFTDSNKNVWVATNDNGLNYFDIPYQKFYHFFHGRTIDDVAEDRYGNLIIASGDKIILNKVKIEGREYKKISIDTSVFMFPNEVINAGSSLHYRIFNDAYKNIYLTTRKAIFKLQFNKQSKRLFVVKLYEFPQPEMSEPRLLQDKATHKFYVYLHGHLVEFADSSFSNPLSIASLPGIARMFIDSRQRLWYQLPGKMCVLNLKTKAVTTILATGAINNLLKAAYCSFEDKNNNFWIGTSGLGILKFTDELNFFHQMLPGAYIYNLQQYNNEMALIEGRYKVIFSSDHAIHTDSIDIPGKLENPVIKYTIDKKYNYWFLHDDKLQMYNAANKRLRIIPVKNKLRKDERLLFTLNAKPEYKNDFLYIDRNNNLWFQCYNKMMSYNINADTLTIYPLLPIFKDVDRSFRVLYEDVNGTFWITLSQDFYSYNPANGKTNFFYHTVNDTSSVAGSNISCFCDDPVQPQQFLWIGTRGNGISRLDKSTGKCVSFNTKKGLPNNVIYGLLTDDKGNLWGSTNKGLFRLNVKSGNIRSFDVTDGLQGNEFNRYAYLKLNNHILLFGGLNGLNYFNPDEVQPIPAPDVELTNIKIFNKELNLRNDSTLIKTDVSYLKYLRIKSSRNVINFEFAATDYRKLGAVHYQYKLQGFDGGWNDNGLTNNVTYTNLDPGNYTLLVQASNDDVNWSKENILLQLQVLPMWWQTWLFKIMIACLLLAGGYAVYSYRLQTFLRIERVRNNIAKDLHDEIGSTLSSISIYSKVAQKHVNTKEASPDKLLEKISENADKVMDSMNDIVWSINAKNDEFENIFYRMREHAIEILETENYTVHFDFDDRLNSIKIDMQRRKNFYLIYKEAMNNIAKYAEGKNVWITLQLINNDVCLNIKDDGKGFDINKKYKNGNGLLNIQHRAAALNAKLLISSEAGKGTVIQLSFRQHTR